MQVLPYLAFQGPRRRRRNMLVVFSCGCRVACGKFRNGKEIIFTNTCLRHKGEDSK